MQCPYLLGFECVGGSLLADAEDASDSFGNTSRRHLRPGEVGLARLACASCLGLRGDAGPHLRPPVLSSLSRFLSASRAQGPGEMQPHCRGESPRGARSMNPTGAKSDLPSWRAGAQHRHRPAGVEVMAKVPGGRDADVRVGKL